ncbi:MAG: EAL domain-containing protein [Steroidobacteraceae bacterium]
MTDVPASVKTLEPLYASFAQLADRLLEQLDGILVLDHALQPRAPSALINHTAVRKWLRSLGWLDNQGPREPGSIGNGTRHWLTAIPMETADAALVGVFCVRQTLEQRPASASRHAIEAARRLKPLLDCVHRELAARVPVRSRVEMLTERTAELEWLFEVISGLKGSSDDRRVVEELLALAAQRLGCAYAALEVPDKRMRVEFDAGNGHTAPLRKSFQQTRQHLYAWAQRQNRPLLVNGSNARQGKVAACKLLSVPVVRDTGRVIGMLAFYNPISAADFATRHVFLARHLGRQTASIVDTQFDLVTGLYTREGLEQTYAGLGDSEAARSVVYFDIDHMHVVNELHGFELGNELIVRIADLMSPPRLPADALAARLSGDRFAIILPTTDSHSAEKMAAQIQAAAAQIVIGPKKSAVEVSMSCGISALVNMPQGLARALAAAELACKTAKSRGRNRIETYACEDDSMMRRHDDVIAVGKLRDALKSDRLLLFAQRITPLKDPTQPGGYELLLRLKDEDGELITPGPLIKAAQRYQLLPSVDRWVTQRALQMLKPFRGMLRTRGIGISINVSGQSIGDEAYLQELKSQLHEAGLPRGCITIELTEHAAVSNLARANQMIRELKGLGCGFALDDFGTGANSLTYVKSLQIGRVKIDGSFVRDILTDRNSRATVRAIVELAKGLSIDTVAEFVETSDIADAVRKLGVDYAQGYCYGKPEPLEDLLRKLDSEESQRLRKLFLEM